MTRLPNRFIEDRAMRDKARAVLAEDIENLRASLDDQGIASRVSTGVTSTISTRIRSGARDVLDQAKAQAGDNKGVIALLVGAIILWFAREPIFQWFEELLARISNELHDLTDAEQTPDTAPEGDPE